MIKTYLHRAIRTPKLIWLLQLAALLSLAACGPKELTEQDRTAIVDTLEAYLPLLAESYSSGDLEPLKELASEREVARVFTRVSELAEEGKYVQPTFHRMTVEDIVQLGHANVYVITLEVWDLRVIARGSEAQLGEDLDQRSRVKYQLTRRGGRWQVLLRELDQAIQ